MRRWLLTFSLALLTGCAVGPNYKRPGVAVPDQYRGAPAAASPNSLADTKWPELFEDDVLKKLIATALERNLDLRIASERVLEARAQLGITRANQFPFLNADAGFTAARSSSVGSSNFIPAGTPLASSFTLAGGSLSWEVDLWGRLRRLTESARAQYLATGEARRGIVISLVSEVASSYYSLREQDLELEIGKQTRDTAADSLRIVQLRHDHGAASGLDVYQAQQLLFTATAQIASDERQIAQSENALSLLLGGAPADIPRGASLEQTAQHFSQNLPPAQLPAGLPSSLLERRPDIRQAEQNLISANAQIGAARALYFPQISLTGFFGGQSRALTAQFTGPARQSSIAPSAVLPIFNAGQVRSGVRLSEALEREALANYQRTIYSALREVSDAVVAYNRTREQRAQQESLVHALSESTRLSNLRYKGGLDSYLQVLDAQRNLFQGQLVLSQLRLAELLDVVQIYRALGGGW